MLGSCREIKVETIVNDDGSFVRIIKITGDSTDVMRSGLPYPVDDTWEKVLEKDTIGNDEYLLTYTKQFSNSNALNNELEKDTGWRKKLKRSINIDKSFGVFYSYITYIEKIEAANPFTYLNYQDYISKTDLMWLTSKKIALNSSDSTALDLAEDIAEKYLEESFTAEIIQLLKSGLTKLNDPSFTPNDIDRYRDSISRNVNNMDFDSSSELADNLATWTGNEELFKLKSILKTQFEDLDNKIEFLWKTFQMEEYEVSVELPGLITETNSLSVVGNNTSWKVNSMSILFEDYVMKSESRVINIWMFIGAGIVILLFLIMLLVKSFR